MDENKKRLGKGLMELLGESESATNNEQTSETEVSSILSELNYINVSDVIPNPFQPRKKFNSNELEELKNSIQEKGILQPIIVYKLQDNKYQLIAGERRWRAAQLAGIHKIPSLILAIQKNDIQEIALTENIQRVELNPIEEASAYISIIDNYGYSQIELSKKLGKSRAYIANMIRLLDLPSEVQGYLADGFISIGHARSLLSASNPLELAKRCIKDGLSVRQVEKIIAFSKENSRSSEGKKVIPNAEIVSLEQDLSAALGLKVKINHKMSNKTGQLSLYYEGLEQLDEICKRLCHVNSEYRENE
jgi:ParB family chromosome partitioning protein